MPWEQRICPVCNQGFTALSTPSRSARGKFCSRKCKGVASRGVRNSPSTEFGNKEPWNKGKTCPTGPRGPMKAEHRANLSAALKGRTAHNKRDPQQAKCLECGIDFLHKNPPSRPRKFCSLTCQRANSVRKSHQRVYQSGENHHNWKGDNVGYFGVHSWVEKVAGKPQKCQQCGCTDAPKFHWHNINGQYRRDLSDWQRLCTKCHAHVHKAWEARWGVKV